MNLEVITTGPYRVFVYGSLMKGLSNHRVLGDAEMIGTAEIEPTSDKAFEMRDLGPFPGIFPVDFEEGQAIQGEVYDVDYGTLRRLDRLEGVNVYSPQAGLYYRTSVVVSNPSDPRIDGTIAWTYVLTDRSARGTRRTKSGSWPETVSNRRRKEFNVLP